MGADGVSSAVRSVSTQRIRRGFGIGAGAAAALVAGWFVYVSINIVSPSQGELNSRSDAVVSLSPQTHRLTTAQQLVEAGNADTLVISHFPGSVSTGGPDEAPAPVSDYCNADGREEILCFTPEENATIGEAHAVRDIVQAKSWESLTVVTSKYHAFRTRFIFEQCLGDDVDVNVVFAERDLTISQWGFHILYENFAFLKALWQTTVRC